MADLQLSDAQLNDLFAFLRFPSISTDPAHAGDVRACAEWLCRKLTAIGLNAVLHATPGHPIVVARNVHQPGRPTVLIYGHYDVQPVDPLNLWLSPPFEPRVENGIVFARGSTDNKGQILAHIHGVEETLRKNGDLPVNLIFLIEGEEEVGSASLEGFLREHREELRCDVIAISDTGMVAPGHPTLTYSLRGITAMEVRISGPTTDLHSGIYGGAVMNPADAIARLVASLHDAEGRIAIKGFYDDVIDPEEWERKAWKELPFGDPDVLKVTGSPALFGEPGFTSLERMWARPTVEVNGIGGGFQGEGTKTVIPREAFAKLTCRLVPNQTPEKIQRLLSEHLRQHCPPGVKLSILEGHCGEPYLMDPRSKFGLAAQRALSAAFDKPVALIREGGSIPIVNTFGAILGVDTLLLGLALPDCRAHAPNENFPLANLASGIRLNAALLKEMAVSCAG